MIAGNEALGTTLARGMVAGVAGTVVMTAFQKLVEMPLSGRGDSYAPADLAEKLLPLSEKRGSDRDLRNYVTHFALGAGWGAARAVVGRAGLSGPPAVAAVFGAMYPGDIAIVAGLGLDRPSQWSVRDWTIDTADKLVLAVAASAAYELLEGS